MRVAVVAAASKGLGRAAAEALAADGLQLAICARGAEALESTAAAIRDRHGVEVLPMVADLARADQAAGFVDRAVAHFGGVDVLVTNAGGPRSGTFDTLSEADWQAAVDLTLLSVVHLCRAALPSMRRRGGGRIIQITSVSVKQPIDGLMLSNALRAAVVGFSKTLATEVARDGITVNCVAPGYTLTDRVDELNRAAAARQGVAVETVAGRLLDAIPAGRFGQPHELAALIAFLASDRAAYLTGTTIPVDGGFVRSLC
jgi:3-oxoacyl-[acyl-carrier protein] reductase